MALKLNMWYDSEFRTEYVDKDLAINVFKFYLDRADSLEQLKAHFEAIKEDINESAMADDEMLESVLRQVWAMNLQPKHLEDAAIYVGEEGQ